jgi:hypothetical protein
VDRTYDDLPRTPEPVLFHSGFPTGSGEVRLVDDQGRPVPPIRIPAYTG